MGKNKNKKKGYCLVGPPRPTWGDLPFGISDLPFVL
jgi:hypothetical protein